VCEGYRFTLTKVQPSELRRGDDLTKAQAYATGESQGQLPAVVRACLARLRGGLTKIPSNPTPAQVVAYAAQLKGDLRDVIETGNVHDCTLLQRLNAVVIPAGTSESAAAQARAAIAEMLQIVIDLFRECICSALLPPCGVGCADDCVPLATVTVRSSDLRVLDICNWSARQFVITMPTLSYWLGWLPIFGTLRNALERLCCTRAERPSFELNDRLKVREEAGAPKAAFAEAASTSSAATAAGEEPASPPAAAFGALAGQYATAWSSLSGLEATVLGAVGARSTRNKPMASDVELDHPLAALALGRIGVDAGAELLGPALASRLVAGAAPQSGHEDRLASLEESLTKLRRKVDTQARTIRDLRAKGPDQ
jgi:hypothetical protein